MTTTLQIVNDAADLAGVYSEGQSLSGDRSSRYIRALNQMLDGWRNEGVDLGLSTLSSGDTVYVDSADEGAIVYNLAVIIFEIQKRPVNPSIFNRANELFESLQAKYLDINEMPIPESLRSNHHYNINTD